MDDNISYLAVVLDNVKDEIAWGETFDYLDDAFEWSYNFIGDELKNKNMSPFTEMNQSEEDWEEINWISNSADGAWTLQIQPVESRFEESDDIGL